MNWFGLHNIKNKLYEISICYVLVWHFQNRSSRPRKIVQSESTSRQF